MKKLGEACPHIEMHYLMLSVLMRVSFRVVYFAAVVENTGA
jgi:hypothetical protein